MLGKPIPLFHVLNVLPIPLDIWRLNYEEGIEITMKKENGKYHNKCRIKFNNTKLERAHKRHMSPMPSGESVSLLNFLGVLKTNNQIQLKMSITVSLVTKSRLYLSYER